jgi:hypothetical protein
MARKGRSKSGNHSDGSCSVGGPERRARYCWEIIADNLSKAGWSWGCVSAIDSNGRMTWIADAHRGNSLLSHAFSRKSKPT